MARKIVLGEELVMDTAQQVKQIVRSISKSGRTDENVGYFNVDEVNKYLSQWLDQGFKFFNTHYLGENEVSYIVLYILVKG